MTTLESSLWLSGLSAALCVATTAGAQIARASDRARVLSASPDAPAVGVAWRGSLRGTLAAAIPVAGARGPVELRVVPFVELHDERGSSSPLPNRSWRGRLAIEGWWRRHGAPERGEVDLRVGLAIEHESDHATSRRGDDEPDGFLELNDVALRSFASLPLGGDAALTPSADARLFAISCTRIEAPCRDYEGSTTGGGALGAVVDGGGFARSPAGWYPFAALEASGVVGRGTVGGERRIALHVGAWTPARAGLGTWQLFGLAFAGNEVGIDRAADVVALGGGARWSFAP